MKSYYNGLSPWAKIGTWTVGLGLAIYFCLYLFLHLVLGIGNYERHVIVKNSENWAELRVINPGAFSSYDTVISVASRAWFSKPCRAFNIRRTDIKKVDIRWMSDDHLVITVSESAEVDPWESCSNVTFTFERQPDSNTKASSAGD